MNPDSRMDNFQKGTILKKCTTISDDDLYYYFHCDKIDGIDIIMPKEFAKRKYNVKDCINLKVYRNGTSPTGSLGIFVKPNWF